MTATKLLTLLIAALLVTAGAGTAIAAEGTATATATNEPTETPDEDDGNETDVGVDASYDNGTVDLTVTTNDTGAANVSVTANGDAVGETNANGSLTFETNATEELELTLTGETFTAEYEYAIENGSLVLEESEIGLEEDGEKGPDENADETAHTVWATIQQWLSGERSGNLGALIQEAFGHDNGSNGNADERGNAGENGKSDEKKPTHAAQTGKDAKDHGNGKQKAGEKNGHGKDKHADADDDSDDETATDA